MPILDAVRSFARGLAAFLSREQPGARTQASALAEEVFRYFPFTQQAQDWLCQRVRIEILDPSSMAGGGKWYPGKRLVRLKTAQYEAAIHELAHALWEEQRRDRQVRDGLVAAVRRLAEDDDPQWHKLRALAHDYVHGIPTQPGFEHGFLLPSRDWGKGGGPQGEWDDHEMFAGLASGCKGDIRLLPPYVRAFYRGVFAELAPDAPAPEGLAPHR